MLSEDERHIATDGIHHHDLQHVYIVHSSNGIPSRKAPYSDLHKVLYIHRLEYMNLNIALVDEVVIRLMVAFVQTLFEYFILTF